MGDQTVYSTWHSIWGSSITSETDLNLKAYDTKWKLVTNVLTETPSFRRVGIDFPKEGIEPKERYSYVLEYDFPRQFGNLKDGWYEFSVDSMTSNLEIEIKLPKNAILEGIPICYILKDGTKFPMEELQPKRKGNHFLIKFKTKKVAANQVFRIEFKAKSSKF